MSLSNFEEGNLAKVWKNEAPTKASAMYLQLHKGDPGEECTSNVAEDTTRKAITLGSITNGVVKNSAAIEWTVPKSETITHGSVWDASSAGNARIYGSFAVSKELKEGEEAKIKVEELALTLA